MITQINWCVNGGKSTAFSDRYITKDIGQGKQHDHMNDIVQARVESSRSQSGGLPFHLYFEYIKPNTNKNSRGLYFGDRSYKLSEYIQVYKINQLIECAQTSNQQQIASYFNQ